MANENKDGGINYFCLFVVLLQVSFIVLKICCVINWSWLWVLSPIWIEVVFDVFIIILANVISRFWKR